MSTAMRIGEVAETLGLSTRTLRYYEEVGLLVPNGRTAGGSRRYTEVDIQRVRYIRRLQELMGFDLEGIRELLGAEDRLAALRAEFQAGPAPGRVRELAAEATELYDRMIAQVDDKVDSLQTFQADLRQKRLRANSVASKRSVKRS